MANISTFDQARIKTGEATGAKPKPFITWERFVVYSVLGVCAVGPRLLLMLDVKALLVDREPQK